MAALSGVTAQPARRDKRDMQTEQRRRPQNNNDFIPKQKRDNEL